MSEAVYREGLDYLKSTAGVWKGIQAVVTILIVIFTIFLGNNFEPQFLCGVAIYAFMSAVFLAAFHLRGFFNNCTFPWIWVECINSGILTLLFFISSTLLVIILTRGCIVTGVVGYVAVTIYFLDTFHLYHMARKPETRYVWTTPNMPE